MRAVRAVCIADIAPNFVALYASRAQGAHFTDRPEASTVSKKLKKAAMMTSGTKLLTMRRGKQLNDQSCAAIK